MTREEAIETLKLLKPNMRFDNSGWLYTKQALDMAIQALSQVTEVRKLILQAERAGVHLDYGAYLFMNALEKVVGEKQIGEFEQEPCEDDGVDHEKIRKAFAKESDIKKADIADMVTKVIMQAEEETDRFIFNTIRPYCEEITQQEISKEILSKALTQYFSKPTECDDAISRDAVMNEVKCWIGSGEYRYTNATDYLSKRIRELPPVTPSRRKGYWKKIETPQGYCDKYVCSVCGYEIDTSQDEIDEHNYCPNCGAKMVEPQESEE